VADIAQNKFSDGIERPILSGVPDNLMDYTVKLGDFREFQRTGFEVYTMLNAASLKHSGKQLHEHPVVLDFGCGAGRIMQYLPAGPELHGCDVNAHAVSFTSDRFKRATVTQNAVLPPLDYADGTFDLIYSFSVFSHLRLDQERMWLGELARVGAKGCLYLITVHGDWFIETTMGAVEKSKVEKSGFYYKTVHQRSGGPMDFPEGYEASYHTSSYILSEWSSLFRVLEIFKGDGATRYLFDGMPESMRADLTGSRPMGQDLVVMRKY
jgi:SAM-dependent methyltransferase